MIGHTVLGEVIGADALAAVAAADLAAALLGDGGALLFLLGLIEAGAEDLHGAILVFILAALVLAFDDRAGGQVRDADGAFGFVDMLAARAGGPVGVDLQIVRIEPELHLADLGQDGDRGRRGVDPPAGFGDRDTLDAVAAGLELQPGPGALALDDKADLLEAAELGLAGVCDLDAPAAALGVHGIHAEKVGGKQHALLPADAAADLHDDVFAVVRVLRQQQEADLALARFPLCFGGAVFLLVAELQRGVHVVAGYLVGAVGLDDRRKLARLAVTGGEGGRIGIDLRPRHAGLELFILIFQLFQLFKHGLRRLPRL